MGFLGEFFKLLLAGIILWLTMVSGLWFAGFVVSILPLGALGGFSEIVGIILLIAIFGAVGRFGIRYIP